MQILNFQAVINGYFLGTKATFTYYFVLPNSFIKPLLEFCSNGKPEKLTKSRMGRARRDLLEAGIEETKGDGAGAGGGGGVGPSSSVRVL